MKYLALGLVEIHGVHMGTPHACPGLTAWHPDLKHMNSITQLGVILKLVEGALHPVFDVIGEGNVQYWSWYGPLRDKTYSSFPFALWAIG